MSTRVNMAVGRIERQLWVYVKNQGVDTGQIFFTRFERKNTQTYFLLFKGLSDCSTNVPEDGYEAQEPQDEHKREDNSETARPNFDEHHPPNGRVRPSTKELLQCEHAVVGHLPFIQCTGFAGG